jgi:hypothetical protein
VRSDRLRHRHSHLSLLQNRRDLLHGKLLLLGIELGRKFVGLKADFTSVPMARLVTNSDSESVARFLKKTSRPKLTCRLEPNNSTMEQGFIYAVADELRNTL